MIDQLVATVARLTSFTNKKPQKLGTGFFYKNNSTLYFITNRHNVIKEDENYYADEILLRLHTDPNNIEKNSDLIIPLYSDKKPLWKEYPKFGKDVDVVAIPLDEKYVTSNYFIVAFTTANHVPNDITIPLGQEVLVMGFPKGLYDEKHNLPIIRDAILASVYPVPFQGKPFVLIDSHLHKGTSGSPVFTTSMNMIQTTSGQMQIRTGNTRYLVGIHSASIDVEGTEDKDPLGLNCVWLASLIDEMTR